MNDERVLFKDLIQSNLVAIRDLMRWENYNLNSVEIDVTELVKDDALMVLEKSYGRTRVYPDILDDFMMDVFIHFPILLQQLAITRLIDGEGVVKDDISTVETIRNEDLTTQVDQNSTSSQTATQDDTNTIDTENKTTGTVSTDDDSSSNQTSETNIENVSGTDSTGMRNVNISHNFPEQSLNNDGNFPTDEQGTPLLNNIYLQQANEGFTTSNPINSNETSNQTISNTDETTNSSLVTNDITVANTGTTNRTITNEGSDNSELISETKGNNTINETVTSTTTNKQYAYEVKAFLETAESTIAFKNWVDNFSWIEGII